ncbi:zonular occludens toxin domain-containing protein [Alcaligenes faecalis]|uniref:zonular occludens toxin domain-containing protein n=1 Tax=Alcaligenes faecalis TaxID=511 RepID=UPI0005A71EAA|nr:zonular occludens toxin domain-containing protein [Alcaligenes faecalis]ATH99166.1 Zonular occludens toxin [Alcaligenes faecalis]AYZ91953.1 Zonular occludens toxin [Alcaligenes faecalis]MCX5595585.1 Zonular occludens toxin [Alcaligenes faecalis]QQC32241.1 Zonular occludens toxin [Alcaligenes faecalis]CAJ0900528.1 zona occludens toxin [Alcaligenes faecalis subsp. faecalis]
MAITVYTGLMGSGKSYECVSSAIVPAVKAGRRVITNVDGIDNDAIRAYCQEKYAVPPERLGSVVHCKNEDVEKSDFFPYGEDVDTFCQPGDLICIDEAWRFWGAGDGRLLKEHKIFFREHRHYIHPQTKVCCDLVLMVQDISDLTKPLKVIVEVTFRTTKIKTLGWNKTYRVEMWEGYNLNKKTRVAVQNKRYDPQIFPLYSSYTGGAGKELQVDDRQNVLKSPKLWILAVLIIGLFSVSVYTLMGFFGSKPETDNAATSTAYVDSKTNSALPASAPAARAQPRQAMSTSWRLIGTMQAGKNAYAVIQSTDGRMRLEHPSNFQNSGAVMIGEVDGERITAWSGSKPTSKGQ